MKKSFLLWLIALILTIFLAAFQRITGPTYPVSGEVNLTGKIVGYSR